MVGGYISLEHILPFLGGNIESRGRVSPFKFNLNSNRFQIYCLNEITKMQNYDYFEITQEIIAIKQHEECLRKLMQEIGNEVIQENGQRKIGGPPPRK